jgi:hypothetical protein
VVPAAPAGEVDSPADPSGSVVFSAVAQEAAQSENKKGAKVRKDFILTDSGTGFIACKGAPRTFPVAHEKRSVASKRDKARDSLLTNPAPLQAVRM